MITTDFRPDWASPPGDTIKDRLFESNIDLEEFALKTDLQIEDARNLLNGKYSISIGLARKLNMILGSSIEFWITRDMRYRENISKQNLSFKEWINDLPISDMIKFNWIPRINNFDEKIETCFKFFNVSNIDEWQNKYSKILQTVSFKKTNTFESNPSSVATWIRQSEIQAAQVSCKDWNPIKFEWSLSEIRSLTTISNSERFIPILQRICSECGVVLVFVPTPKGCPVSGATKFLSPKKAMITQSFRYKTNDHFWFTFFHEAAHLILHGSENLFLEIDDMIYDSKEEEANQFAEEVLIPIEHKSELLNLSLDTKSILRFSKKLDIAPGIIVGQLQHHKIISYDYLNKLKRKIDWEFD